MDRWIDRYGAEWFGSQIEAQAAGVGMRKSVLGLCSMWGICCSVGLWVIV